MSLFQAAETLSSISDAKSLELFKIIAAEESDSDMLKNKSKLTRKQYYSRISGLTKAGLIKRENGIYHITTFGKIVHHCITTIEVAGNNYWKLKTIDSLDRTSGIPSNERIKVIESLIDAAEIKEILVKG